MVIKLNGTIKLKLVLANCFKKCQLGYKRDWKGKGDVVGGGAEVMFENVGCGAVSAGFLSMLCHMLPG